MRRVTEGGGTVLVIDEQAAESFQPGGDPIDHPFFRFYRPVA